MSRKKILVTGGAGFIGSHTVTELYAAGLVPVIVDNFSNSERFIIDRLSRVCAEKITAYDADCTDREALQEIFKTEKPEGVIHFAAFKAVGESVQDPLRYYRNNIFSLIALLEVMEAEEVSDLVFSSSCTVYGQPTEIPVTENADARQACSPYGFTKIACEQLISDQVSSGKFLRSALLRYFNPIGAHSSGLLGELPRGVPNNLVPFVTQTAAGKRSRLTIFGTDYDTPDGTCLRDYIHVMDLARAHVAALQWLQQQPEKPVKEVFNIGAGKGYSVKEVVETFERVNQVSVPRNEGPRRDGDVEKIWASTRKAETRLGWKAEKSLEKALQDAWNWEKNLTL